MFFVKISHNLPFLNNFTFKLANLMYLFMQNQILLSEFMFNVKISCNLKNSVKYWEKNATVFQCFFVKISHNLPNLRNFTFKLGNRMEIFMQNQILLSEFMFNGKFSCNLKNSVKYWGTSQQFSVLFCENLS